MKGWRPGWFRFFLVLAVLLACVGVRGHIGSPSVVYEGPAGPWEVRVFIQPPEVVPGRARINVRVHNGPAKQVSALPVRWDAGRKGAPPPDLASAVPGERNLYTTELWLMDFGAYSVFVDVEGRLGKGTAIVPVNSVSTQRLGMPRWLGVLLGLAGATLVLLLVMLVGAAVREAVLEPGVEPDRKRVWRGRIFMGVAVVLIFLVLRRGKNWWEEVDSDFRNNRLYKPVEILAKVTRNGTGDMLELRLDPRSRDWKDYTPIVPDHGKLMHLFLVREPGLDAFAHLHPVRVTETNYVTGLPALPSGDYAVYADVTHESGFSQTLVAKVKLGDGSGSNQLEVDDSWWVEDPLAGDGAAVFEGRLRLRRLNQQTPLARNESLLRFDLVDEQNEPVPLEPYMGMWSHAVIRSRDGTVFTHLHPSGTISMAAQEWFARREAGRANRPPLDVICGRMPKELNFPYVFPKEGDYRIWVQAKSGGKVLTGAFWVKVE